MKQSNYIVQDVDARIIAKQCQS